jgi:hypothetical protein
MERMLHCHPTMTGSKSVASVLMAVFLIGCVVEHEEAVDSHHQEIGSVNSYGVASFSASSALLIDLGANQLLVGDQVNLSLNELSSDDENLLTYTVHCALGPNDVVFLTVGGVSHQFTGALNLVPGWTKVPLTSAHDRQLMSGCLLAHINEYQAPVHISLRTQDLVTTQDELSRYLSFEGAFYGDLFDPAQPMYACSGDSAPDFSVSYPNHDTTAGDRLLRRCTDVATPGGTETLCGFQYAGACSDVCDTPISGGYGQCWSNAARTGSIYDTAVNAWQLAFDDAESTWPVYYPLVFGP